MGVTIHIPSTQQHLCDDKNSIIVDGNTVGECFNELVAIYPKLREELFDHQLELKNAVEVYINDKSAYPNELIRSVSDGDEIFITTILSGG